jgi:hypothetical protein
MIQNIRRLSLAGLLTLAAGAASAAANVNFIEPGKFSDLPFTPWQRQQALDDIAEHFKDLGKTLPPGQDINIDVLDVDLAGREQPNGFSVQDIRVLRQGPDWPRMQLRFSLVQNGQAIKSGEAQLSDKSYMNHLNTYPGDARLRYEKQMIDEWWQQTIGPARPRRK